MQSIQSALSIECKMETLTHKQNLPVIRIHEKQRKKRHNQQIMQSKKSEKKILTKKNKKDICRTTRIQEQKKEKTKQT